MRPAVVVVHTPAINAVACVVQTGEPMQIQAVVAELAVETLDESILSRFTWLNEMELDASTLRPEKHRLTG